MSSWPAISRYVSFLVGQGTVCFLMAKELLGYSVAAVGLFLLALLALLLVVLASIARTIDSILP